MISVFLILSPIVVVLGLEALGLAGEMKFATSFFCMILAIPSLAPLLRGLIYYDDTRSDSLPITPGGGARVAKQHAGLGLSRVLQLGARSVVVLPARGSAASNMLYCTDPTTANGYARSVGTPDDGYGVSRFQVRIPRGDWARHVSGVSVAIVFPLKWAGLLDWLSYGWLVLYMILVLIACWSYLALALRTIDFTYLDVSPDGVRVNGSAVFTFERGIKLDVGREHLEIASGDRRSDALLIMDGRHRGGAADPRRYLRIIAATIQDAMEDYAEKKRDPYRGQATAPREGLVDP